MVYFEFSSSVIDAVINELEKSKKYIRIAIFQLHHQDVFDVLNRKLNEGVKVELFTLPYESINLEVREVVTKQFEKILNNGAILHFCKWHIGDPNETRMADLVWFSYHGKFIVTDSSAIALSANFIQQEEIDALLVYSNDEAMIQKYNGRFDELLDLFIRADSNYDGSIRRKIVDSGYAEYQRLFELPLNVDEKYERNWITDYPDQLCPDDVQIANQLYIIPFDVKARHIIEKIIGDAENYVYISTESFNDQLMEQYLIRKSLSDVDIKILTGTSSRDYRDRFLIMLRNLLASNIKIHTPGEKLHAKLIVTDKHLAVSSINLNQINLGIKKSGLWRGNTETIAISTRHEIVCQAKTAFETIFEQGKNVQDVLEEKVANDVKWVFTKIYGLSTKKEVKELLSRYIVSHEIEIKRATLKIARITAKLMNEYQKKLVKKEYILQAFIMYYLSENKLRLIDLEKCVSVLKTEVDLPNLLSFLTSNGYIEMEGDYYKLRVESLI